MPFELSPSDEQKLAGIHPKLAAVIRRAARNCPIRFKVLEGMRTVDRQRQLVKKGASKTMNSRHLTGHAVDIAPVDQEGKIPWTDWPMFYKIAPCVKAAAKAEGVPIEWGGDWKSFKDGPHWQLPFKQFPKVASRVGLMGDDISVAVADEPPYTLETEGEAATKAVATAGGGAVTGAAIALEPIGKAVDTLTSQQSELTSGDLIRIVIAVGIIALTAWLAYRKAKS